MSKKNLARTVIEGGRASRSKYFRRKSNKKRRVKEKEFFSRIKKDIDLCDEIYVDEVNVVCKDFSDKLGPVMRFLESNIGNSWNLIRSEISKKFDFNTTAGRHIIYDHLLPSVHNPGSDIINYGRRFDESIYIKFFVDENGILQKNPNYKKRNFYLTNKDCDQIIDFLKDRMLIEKDNKLWWAFPTDGIWKAEYNKALNYYNRYDKSFPICSIFFSIEEIGF